MKGLALKVTYNDGGCDAGLIGYRGVCTDAAIVENIKVQKTTWCRQPHCPCKIYFDSGLQGRRPRVRGTDDGVCYESTLLLRKPVRFGAGYYHGKKKTGPIPLRGAKAGQVAFLTTVLPGTGKGDRVVFGCFRIGEIIHDDPALGHVMVSDGSMDVILPDEIVRQVAFWRYHKNSDGSTAWGTGLFRFMRDKDVDRLLGDLVWLLDDRAGGDTIINACGDSIPIRPFRREPAHEARCYPGEGYGGGESDDHRNLKMLVAGYPKKVGLPASARPQVEHPFLSGDQVDIAFALPGGAGAVVEIETVCPLPGIHQAIKYRALLEVEKGLELCSGHVQAIVVAHGFDDVSRALAQQYGVRLVELRA